MRVFKSTYGGSRSKTARWYVEVSYLGVARRIAGFEDRTATQDLGARVAKLARLKQDGLAPDRELVLWIDGLPPRIHDALRRIGLASASDPRRFRPLVDPKAKDKKPSEPKDDLVADFGEVLRARRKSEKHIEAVTRLARRLFLACHFKSLADIDAEKVERRLAAFRTDEKLSIRTSNHILSSAKEVTRWAVAQ